MEEVISVVGVAMHDDGIKACPTVGRVSALIEDDDGRIV